MNISAFGIGFESSIRKRRRDSYANTPRRLTRTGSLLRRPNVRRSCSARMRWPFSRCHPPRTVSILGATDFSQVDALLRDLHLGPYAFREHWSILRFWEEYKTQIMVSLLFIHSLIAHNFRTSSLMRRLRRNLRRLTNVSRLWHVRLKRRIYVWCACKRPSRSDKCPT